MKMRSAVLRTWWLGDFCSYWPDFLDWSMSHQSEVSVQHFPQTVCGKASALRLQLPRLRVQHGGNVKQHSHRVNVQLFSFGRFGRSVNVLDGPGGILTHTGCLEKQQQPGEFSESIWLTPDHSKMLQNQNGKGNCACKLKIAIKRRRACGN